MKVNGITLVTDAPKLPGSFNERTYSLEVIFDSLPRRLHARFGAEIPPQVIRQEMISRLVSGIREELERQIP